MYNRPYSQNRYQDPNPDQINLKEKQLYLQSSSINPLTGQPIRQDYPQQQSYPSQTMNTNLQQKVALQSSSINPLTGAPVLRNPITYQSYQQQSNDTQQNDPHFQRNLIKFFAADDPRQPPKAKNQISTNDPSFQKNLERFYAADDPNPPKRPNSRLYQNTSSQPQINDPQFQRNLEKFFAADDPRPVQQRMQQQRAPQRSPHNTNPTERGYQQPSLYQQYNGASQQNLTEQRLAQDPQFQKNLTKFFAADDNSVPAKLQNSHSYQQQKQIQQLEQQRASRLENDPRFQKNLQQFFGIDDPRSNQGVQGTMQQSLNKQPKIITIIDSSSSARNYLQQFFRTRGIEEFDVFCAPGGVFGIVNNQLWEQCLQQYFDTINKAYTIKELYIISVLDTNSNTKLFTNVNDKRSHQIAIEDLRTVLQKKMGIQFRLNGIIIDQRGGSEKVF